MKFLMLALTILTCGFATSASAKLLQIIHTNDLHSFFEGSRSGLGGYSRIKTVIDRLRADAEAKGIRTLHLDAGDFGEGSSYYASNKGVDAFRALDILGIDVTVLGNHDFMMGGKDLARQIKESKLQANFLSANLKGKPLMGLKHKIHPYVDYDLDGMKVRIFGLTTPEIHYQYPLLPQGYIGPAHKKGIQIAYDSRKEGVDFLIGLTHIGVDKDTILLKNSRSINMIIGGHSHTRLEQPRVIENLDGEMVSTFQTGAHGMAVGSVLVDVLGDGEAKIIDYRLYDVSKDLAENADVKKFVTEAYENRERYFNRSWTEVIGFSEIPLTGNYAGRLRNTKSCWSNHIARLMRETAKSDISLQMDTFQGEEIPAGEIRFGDIVDNFPHFGNWGDLGWSVNRSTISGLILKQVLKLLSSGDSPFDVTVDGLKMFDVAKNKNVNYVMGSEQNLDEALINGETIKNGKFYSIALPSELPAALGKFSSPIRDILLINSHQVENSYFWPLFEGYLAKNSPLKCLED